MADVRVTVRLLGLDLFDLELTTETADDDDTRRDLSGGDLGSTSIEAGRTDRYMGFTNGREDD